MAEIKITESVKPNSNKLKSEQQNMEDRKKMESAVKNGSVISSKPGVGQKFKSLFSCADFQDVKDYVVYDLLIPGAKDFFMNVMDMVLYNNRPRAGSNGYRRNSYQRNDYVSYSAKYRSSNGENQRNNRPNSYHGSEEIDYRNIVLTSRIDAEEVLSKMRLQIREYGAVSVADLLNLVHLPSNYNDNNWGWTDDRDFGYRKVSNGFLIDVREAVYIG